MNSSLPPRPPRPRDLRLQAGRSTQTAGAFSGGPTLRLLPAVIVAALCMLGFRVQIVVKDLAHSRTATVQVAQSTALAQAAPPTQNPAAQNPPAQNPAAPAPGAPANAPAGQAPAATAGDPAAPVTGTAVNFDPSTLSKSEVETLQLLAERRTAIEQREREIEAKDGLLKAAESRIDGKVAQLQDLEKNIKGLLQQYDGQKAAELDQLVRIYSDMKPQQAASIFETLDMPILVALVQKMKEAKIAPILALMTPAKATAVTEEITSRKQLSANP